MYVAMQLLLLSTCRYIIKYYKNKAKYTRLEQLHENKHTNGAHKNSKDNTTPTIVRLNKTTQENTETARRS
jgi:hypothetical protein